MTTENSNPIGYQTLFVNSKETQVLAQKYRIPLYAGLKSAFNFKDTIPEPPLTISNSEVANTDLLRYNLGKFFYRTPPTDENNFTNYEFVNPNSINNGQNMLLQPSVTNTPDTFGAPLRFRIGETYDDDYIFLSGRPQYSPLSYVANLQNLYFGSTTFIILECDFDTSEAHVGVNEYYIASKLKQQYGLIYPNIDLFMFYLASGKQSAGDQGTITNSPQYLGLGFEVADINSPAYQISTDGKDAYLDHAFTFSHPYALNTQDDLGSVKVLYSNIESKYVFYQQSYEESLNKFKTSSGEIGGLKHELYFPNFYTILKETKTDTPYFMETGENNNYLIHATLGGKLEKNILRTFKAGAPLENFQKTTARIGNQYLDEWANVASADFQNTFDNLDLQEAAIKYRNIIFSPEAVKDSEINISKATFPFYNEITFNTNTSNKIADVLLNSKLFDILILDYIWQNETTGNTDRIFDINFHSYQELKNNATDNADEILGEQLFNLTNNGDTFNAYDFDNFVEQIKNLNSESPLLLSAELGTKRSISANGEEFSDDSFNMLQGDPLTQLIRKMTFLSNYASTVKENVRTYKDIVEGKQAYNETLFYRVEKRSDSGEVIQSFYVLNSSELDKVNLIDTQVKYGKNYTYQIYAIQLVIGNEYSYKKGPNDPRAGSENTNPYLKYPDLHGSLSAAQDPGEIKDSFFSFNLLAETKQSVKLIELPYTSPAVVKLQEAPPVPPNIDFVPYRGIDNQILITFNTGVDEYYDTYIAILEEDEHRIDDSSIVNKNGQTLFKSEGDATGFDMFRISALQMPDGPTSYKDFGIPSAAKRVTLNRKFGDPTFIDNILPNTKYWYTFRTNDKKHTDEETAPDFSNPTVVYQVQMVNNDGVIYLIVETYDVGFFNSQKIILEKQKIKTMRKYLRISPSFDQTLINTSIEEGGTDYYNPALYDSIQNYVENDLNEDVSGFKIGYREQSVFGNLDDDTNNRFKVRLTSKKTGRKIDIFLRFKKPTLEK
jgi:hypothetical protein